MATKPKHLYELTEADKRSLALQAVEIANAQPGMKNGELVKRLGITLEAWCSISVNRMDTTEAVLKTRDPLGREVDYKGVVHEGAIDAAV